MVGRAVGIALVWATACGRGNFDLLTDGSDDPTEGGPPVLTDGGLSDYVLRYPMDDDPTTGTVTATITSYDGACSACPTATTGKLGGGYQFSGAEVITLPSISTGLIGLAPYSL